VSLAGLSDMQMVPPQALPTDDSPGGSAQLRKPGHLPGWKRPLVSLARDFVLIVAGVLTALALENWNGALRERRLEAEYLAALAADVRAQIAHYDRWLDALTRHAGWTSTIWSWANGAAPDRPADEVLLWLTLGGQVNLDTQFQDAAYEDLVNSGRLSLIGDRTLREELINARNSRIRWTSVIEASSARAIERYRTATADLIPPEVGWVAVQGGDVASLQLDSVLAEFRRRPAVRQALVQMAESHRFRAGMAQRNREQAAELLHRLEGASAR
jgi:type II secretory pathway pseudopilin PulG